MFSYSATRQNVGLKSLQELLQHQDSEYLPSGIPFYIGGFHRYFKYDESHAPSKICFQGFRVSSGCELSVVARLTYSS
ncbi:hypothetical protein HZ326_24786 [Fusarium oxysporum f. sp. albedinis]|nr:hypothetical protein HZ326_24786 [Fusarium oxysporum f. sp. albedinis]